MPSISVVGSELRCKCPRHADESDSYLNLREVSLRRLNKLLIHSLTHLLTRLLTKKYILGLLYRVLVASIVPDLLILIVNNIFHC